ncbi:MAG: outer membrane beta-barrel protein [Hyphomicrobiales bacterium]|nr:outer membrane beta-barrel protein [Hyphomicrobiales bacterium]
MKKYIVSALAASTMAFATAAMAADLPAHDYAPQPAAPYAPQISAYNWTGFYAGINGGLTTGGFTSGGSSLIGTGTGGAIGGTLGYNYQMGQFVVGAEGDYDFQNFAATRTIGATTYRGRVNQLGTARLRLGYALDQVLLYGTGGLAFGYEHYNVAGPVTGSADGFHAGWALGAGLEYAFTPNISAKAEYLYTSLSPSTEFGGTAAAVRTGAGLSNIRFGLNYKF